MDQTFIVLEIDMSVLALLPAVWCAPLPSSVVGTDTGCHENFCSK